MAMAGGLSQLSLGRTLGVAVAAVFTSGVLTTGYLWYKKPVVLLKAYLKMSMIRAGLKENSLAVDDNVLSYCERGQKTSDRPTILLVHGFTASKDMWVPTVRYLPRNFHIILIDLPGHGKSSMPAENTDVTLEMFAETLHKFICARGLAENSIHLVGISLGGAICGLYSAQHPEMINRLTLVCPAMTTPLETPFQRDMRLRPGCLLIPESVQGVQEMINLTRYSRITLPLPLLRAILDLRRPRNRFYWKVYKHCRELYRHQEGRGLEDQIRNIRAPVQVIWGRQDNIIHVTGVERLRDLLPDLRRVDIFENCGHSCNMDKTDQLAEKLKSFTLQSMDEETVVQARKRLPPPKIKPRSSPGFRRQSDMSRNAGTAVHEVEHTSSSVAHRNDETERTERS